MIKIIDHPTIMSLKIEPETCLEWVDTVLREKNDEQAGYVLPGKVTMKMSGSARQHSMMPCALTKYRIMGAKESNRFPGRVPTIDSHIILSDMDSGDLIALLDGNFITTMRTAAIAVHSAVLFGKKSFSTIGMIGLGVTAAAIMNVLNCALCGQKMTVYLYKYKNQAEEFIEKFREYKNVEFVICETYSEVIGNSAVVFSCVTATDKNFCDDAEFFQPGCTVIPVHTMGFQNCDLTFDKVYGDDTGLVSHFRYFDRFKSFGEVADVVTGKVKGRENDTERILVYNIGLGIQDLYFAYQIYQMVSDKALPEFDLRSPKEKIWL